MFELEEKVAIVTGGASGIGYAYVKEFLRNGLKGVAFVDINQQQGDIALAEFKKEFGANKVIFICADITNKTQLREAFEETVSVYRQLDILVNNAGIVNEIDLEKCIAVNLLAPIEACILAMDDFFPKYKIGTEGVILNTSSMTALQLYEGLPIYAASKCGIIGYTRTVGITYSDIKSIRIVALCPDATKTSIMLNLSDRMPQHCLELARERWMCSIVIQRPEEVAVAGVKLIQSASSGSVWKVVNGKLSELENQPHASEENKKLKPN